MGWIIAIIGLIISLLGLFVTVRAERTKEILLVLSELPEDRFTFWGNLVIAIGIILLIIGACNFFSW